MRPPVNSGQTFSVSDKTRIILVSLFMAILLFVLGILLGRVIRQTIQLQPLQAVSIIVSPTSISLPTSALPVAIAPTVIVPTADCSTPTLVIGTTTFQLQDSIPAADGSMVIPPSATGIAHWMETAEGNYLFVISLTPENISLEATLSADSSATVTWADCSSKTFSLSTPEPNPVNVSTLMNQLISGLTIFLSTDTSGNGYIVRGELTEMTFP